MMNGTYLPPFTREEFVFEGAWYFTAGDAALLLSRNGTTLLLSRMLADTVAAGKPGEDLAFKLHQRGFSTVYGHPRFIEQPDEQLPRFFMIDFTTKCNCNCVYCLRHFEDVGEAIDETVLEDICRYIIAYCQHHDITAIGFQPWGGEPLIELPKILKVRRLFDEAGIQAGFSVQTNGLLLSVENYELLRQNGIGVGVSIDGDRESHDAHRVDVRGNATHSQIVQRLTKIRERIPEPDIGSISVNSRYTLDHISENIAYLVQELKLKRLKFNLVHPNGADFDHGMLITPEEIPLYVDRVLEGLLDQIRQGYDCTETNIMDKAMNLLCRPDDDLCHSRGCRGGYGFISFSQDGRIYPCELIGSEPNCIGSIYDGVDLSELLERAVTRIPYFRERQLSECADCPWSPFCRGGCKASAMAYGREPWEIDPMECAVNKALYPRLVQLLLERPDDFRSLIDYRVSF